MPTPTRAKASPIRDAHRRRVRQLRRKLDDIGADALLVSNPGDIFYLTGFSGEDSYAVVTSRRLCVISDFRFEEELALLRPAIKVIIRKGSLNAATGELIGALGVQRVAIQGEHLSVATRAELAKVIRARRLTDSRGLLGKLRSIKDAVEVRQIRRAVRIGEDALVAALDQIEPGWSEIEIAALLEYEMKSRGASGISFDTNVSARANGSKPHYRPGRVRTGKGKSLLIDWGARFGGYCGDMTRTFSFGTWPRALRQVYSVVLEAQQTAIDAVQPGVTCRQLDSIARSIIERAGYGPRFGHALGHGIGIDVHEHPRVGRESTCPLEPGMVITVEPGVYLPGVGGVRLEDDILVTSRGGSNLCSLPTDLQWATL